MEPNSYDTYLKKTLENIEWYLNQTDSYLSHKESENIFDIYNTFLQSPAFVQLTVFFFDRVPEIFLPIEKNILRKGLKSFAYHLSINIPHEKEKIYNNIRDMIFTIEISFVSKEDFLDGRFVNNIQNNNMEELNNSLEYLKKYQAQFNNAIEEERFLSQKDCKVLNASGIFVRRL